MRSIKGCASSISFEFCFCTLNILRYFHDNNIFMFFPSVTYNVKGKFTEY